MSQSLQYIWYPQPPCVFIEAFNGIPSNQVNMLWGELKFEF